MIAAEQLHASGVVAVVVTGLVPGAPDARPAVGRLPAADGRVLAAGHVPARRAGLPAGRACSCGRSCSDLDEPLGSLGRGSPRRCSPPSSWPGSSGCSRPPTWPGWSRGSAAGTRAPPVTVPTVIGLGRHARRGDAGRRAGAAARPWPTTCRTRATLFIWLAFAVIVVTLVLQGATLPWLARRLRLPQDDQARGRAGRGRRAARGQPGRPRTPRRAGRRRARRRWWSGCARWPTAAPTRPGSGSGSRTRRPLGGVRSAAARDDRRRAGRLPGRPRRRAGSRRRCSPAPSATWTWKSPCCDRSEDMSCQHLAEAGRAGTASRRTTEGCPECVADGFPDWVHLRAVPGLRARGLLRLVAAPARHGALRRPPAIR